MPYETDERLKSYLDTNQMHREQMCLAVMAIDKRFSEVRPRHPRGGPDGARDIDANFKGAQRAFGAVGFVNQANDSEKHKTKAKNKFTTDLAEALKVDPRPEVFIFFTNVDLTVGEEDELIAAAKSAGLSHAEVFDRERIRISLDGRDGLHIRFQYLGIPLSEAEQAVFFARWGDDIQGVISEGFGKVQSALNRVLFLQEATLHLSHFTCVFKLDREYSGIEIGHFRAFAELYLKTPSKDLVGFTFGSSDNIARLNARTVDVLANGKPGIAQGICGVQWDMTFPEEKPNDSESDQGQTEEKYRRSGSYSSIGRKTVTAISIQYRKDARFVTIHSPKVLELDGCWLVFLLNKALAEKVRSIEIYANEYMLSAIAGFEISIGDRRNEIAPPFVFTEEELADPWVIIRPERASVFTLHFSEETPRRFFHADEVAEPQV